MKTSSNKKQPVPMTFGAGGMSLLTAFEGLRLATYDDTTGMPVGPGGHAAGKLTIGYGHTGPDVTPGMKISPEEAEKLLVKDLAPCLKAVNILPVPEGGLNQNQFDAVVCFTYNAGIGAMKLSKLAYYLRTGEFDKAADEFMKWNHNGREIVAGLTRRRTAERALFLDL